MADNAAGTGFGGASVTFATDDIGGINYPRFKVTFGIDGVATDVSSANPLPTTSLTNTQLRASAVPVSAPATGFQIDVDGGPVGLLNPLPVFFADSVGIFGSVIEDSPHTPGEYGVYTLAVRQDTDGSSAANGDYTSFHTDEDGRLKTSSTLKAIGSDYWPGYSASDPVAEPLHVDPSGALITRGAVTTDEGTFRCNFANTSFAVGIGSVTVSGAVVTGTGFLTADVHYNDYFKLAADADTAYRQIASIDSNTQLTLVSSYVGGSSGTGQRALVQPFTGTGGSLTIASGVLTIAGGTTALSITGVKRLTDYAPLVFRSRLSISQRIANQEIHIGLEEDAATTRWFARFLADGTTNTTIKCETGRNPTGAPSASETETTTVTLPNGLTTASMQDYRIEVLTEVVRFYMSNVLVAQHSRVIPSQHDEMTSHVKIRNGTTPASNTNVLLDYITGKNHNKLEIGVMSDSEQIIAVAVPLQQFSYTFSGSITAPADLIVLDCAQLRSLFIQCNSMGTTGVVTVQWSNTADFAQSITATLLSESGATSTTFNAAVMRVTNVIARYCRLRLTTATTAGTTTINVWGAQTAYTPIITTQPVSGTVAVSGTSTVGGTAAQGAAASGNPVFTGGVAKTAQPTARTDGQIVAPLYSKVGHTITQVGQIRDLNDTISPITLSTTTETTLVPAVAAVFNDIYSITIANTSASAVRVDFRTVAAGAVVESVLVPATSTIQLNPAVPYKQATVNTAWTAQLSAAVTDVRISARVVRNI